MPGHVVAFGEPLIRLSPPAALLFSQARSLDLAVGGAEANVAAGLASLGHAVKFLGAAPDNPLGRRARAELRSLGVDVSGLIAGPGRMGLYFLEAGAGPRASAITYDRAGSAFLNASPEQIDFASGLRGAALLHVSGITPALGPKGGDLARSAVAAARQAGVPVSFDGNFRAQLWGAWDSDPQTVLGGLVAQAAILFGNHRDISLLLGRSFSGDSPQARRQAAEAAFEAFPGLTLIASTTRRILGPDHHRLAARVDRRDGAHETAEQDVAGILDRIGAGDAFATGVLHAWLEGGDAETLARTGLAVAALKHGISGDLCLVSRAELEGFSGDGADVRR